MILNVRFHKKIIKFNSIKKILKKVQDGKITKLKKIFIFKYDLSNQFNYEIKLKTN
jgi:hypothetical protein